MSLIIKEAQVLYNAKGKKTHVILPYQKYEEILEILEDADDLRVVRERKNEPEISIQEVERRLAKKKR